VGVAVERFTLVGDQIADSIVGQIRQRLSVVEVAVIAHEYIVQTRLLH